MFIARRYRRRAFFPFFAAITILALSHCAWAAPFAKRITYTQPNGTPVELWGEGNEFVAVFETLDGYTVVFDENQLAYCYAQVAPDGRQMVSTGVQVPVADPAALGLAPHLRLSPEVVREQAASRYAQWDAAMGISERWSALKAASLSDPDRARFAPPSTPTVGLKMGLTMLIDFTDDPGTVPRAEIINFCNGDNYKGFGNNGSVKKYFQYNSNGKLTYSNAVTLYIRAPKPKSAYNNVSKDAGDQARTLIVDTITVMKSMTNYATEIVPLLANLTTDNRGEVVAFNVFYAGGNGNVWSKGLWPHSWSLASAVQVAPDGKKVRRYQISNIGTQLEIGTFVHENGHMLCGYPDFYDYTGSSQGVGNWCLMAGGSWGGSQSNPGSNPAQISAYLKRASGWATTIDLNISSSLIATVTASPGTNFNVFYRYAKPGTSTEYYLAECRYKTDRDASLPGSGVAIWHIDELGDNSSVNLNPNNSHNNYEATLVQADNLWDLEKNRNGGDDKDLYYLGNTVRGYTNQFSDSTLPKARWWNGSASGLVLRGFSAIGTTMTFSVGTNDPVPVIVGQPASLTVLAGMPASFSATAAGQPPLAFQWLKNGSAVVGATQSAYNIAVTQPVQAGGYSVRVTNEFGATTSQVATLTVIPTIPLASALNTSNLTWATESTKPWYGQTNSSHDAVAAARSFWIGAGQQTTLWATNTGPGTLRFWWKLASKSGTDTLTFSVISGGYTNRLSLQGDSDWREETVLLPDGTHILQWTYAKQSDAAEEDMALLDEIRIQAGATLPRIVRQPVGRNTLAATPVTFLVEALGTPPLAYQWRFNGADLPGATSSVLTVPNPGAQDTGFYSVRVANNHASAQSVEVYLGIVPMVVGGDNAFGQMEVSQLATNAVAISAGAWHSLALREDGQVLAWGGNYEGQCAVPASVSNPKALAAGGYHSLALMPDRTVIGWGANYSGQTTVPAGLKDVVAIAAGSWHSLALRANGTVVAWGDNSFGQTTVPANLTEVTAIAAGGNHNLALRRDGTVVAWGENTDASGGFVGQSVVPMGLPKAVAIAAGEYHSLAVTAEGKVVAWGDDSGGQCQPPVGLADVVAVAGGGGHSVALKRDSTVAAWGYNWNGQTAFAPAITNVVAIAAGSSHTLLLLGRPPAPFALSQAVRDQNRFTVRFPTLGGKNYTLEGQVGLPGTNWSPISTVPGTGGVQSLSDVNATNSQRFYRVRQW
jgi:M6 family metalloprotease-like protein